MKIYDITVPITETMPTWHGHGSVEMQYLSHQSQGDTATVSRLSLSLHTGTHLDAPMHFIRGGDGIETLDLSVLCGRATLVEIMSDEHITRNDLEALNLPADVRRLLIRTKNSRFWDNHTSFHEDYIGMAADAAQWVVDRTIGLVGIDYLSIAPYTALVETHEILLGARVIPVEGLDLRGVPVGDYDLYCLPLNITGRDGAPCRAVLIETT